METISPSEIEQQKIDVSKLKEWSQEYKNKNQSIPEPIKEGWGKENITPTDEERQEMLAQTFEPSEMPKHVETPNRYVEMMKESNVESKPETSEQEVPKTLQTEESVPIKIKRQTSNKSEIAGNPDIRSESEEPRPHKPSSSDDEYEKKLYQEARQDEAFEHMKHEPGHGQIMEKPKEDIILVETLRETKVVPELGREERAASEQQVPSQKEQGTAETAKERKPSETREIPVEKASEQTREEKQSETTKKEGEREEKEVPIKNVPEKQSEKLEPEGKPSEQIHIPVEKVSKAEKLEEPTQIEEEAVEKASKQKTETEKETTYKQEIPIKIESKEAKEEENVGPSEKEIQIKVEQETQFETEKPSEQEKKTEEKTVEPAEKLEEQAKSLSTEEEKPTTKSEESLSQEIKEKVHMELQELIHYLHEHRNLLEETLSEEDKNRIKIVLDVAKDMKTLCKEAVDTLKSDLMEFYNIGKSKWEKAVEELTKVSHSSTSKTRE